MQLPILITGIVIFTICTLLSAILMCGRGGALLSGYNFKAKGEKAQACERYMLRRAGILLFGMGLGIGLIMVFISLDIMLAVYIGSALTGAWFIAGLVFLNTSKKVKRAEYLARKLTKNPGYTDETSPYDDY